MRIQDTGGTLVSQITGPESQKTLVSQITGPESQKTLVSKITGSPRKHGRSGNGEFEPTLKKGLIKTLYEKILQSCIIKPFNQGKFV